jgi:hypothetical protein
LWPAPGSAEMRGPDESWNNLIRHMVASLGSQPRRAFPGDAGPKSRRQPTTSDR